MREREHARKRGWERHRERTRRDTDAEIRKGKNREGENKRQAGVKEPQGALNK